MRYEHVQALHRLFASRRFPVPRDEICDRLEISWPHAKRVIAFMRDALGAPIVNRRRQGYFYDPNTAFELPGVWFTPEELHALLTVERLAGALSGGMFTQEIGAIRNKARRLLGGQVPAPEELRRIRVLAAGSRSRRMPHFPLAATAVLERRRLRIAYHGRARGQASLREISPQRLVHYRNNWYLDAWCHAAEGLRSFAVERIARAEMLARACREVPDAELDRVLAHSFGIFGGEPEHVAVLRFSEFAARWVRDEEWFPDQEAVDLPDGGLELRIPYADPTELIMEICRHGPEVEVIAPESLRQRVAARLRAAAARYDA